MSKLTQLQTKKVELKLDSKEDKTYDKDVINAELAFQKYNSQLTALIDFVDMKDQQSKIDLLEDLENQLVPSASKEDNKNTTKLCLEPYVKDKDKFLKQLNKI